MEGENTKSRGDILYFRRLMLSLGLVLVVGLILALVWLSVKVWLTVFAGVLLAVFFRTLSLWVSKLTGLRPVWSLVLSLLLLAGLLALGAALLAPRLVEQFTELGHRLPAAFDTLQQRVQQSPLRSYLPQSKPLSSQLEGSIGKIAANFAALFKVSVGAVTGFFVILFLGIYLAAAPQAYVGGLVRLFPLGRRPRAREVLDKVGATLGHWLLGQMVSMVVVGTLIAVGLTALGVPLGLALGVIAGLLNFVPIVGSLLSALPAVLLAFLVSPVHPLYVVGLYVLVNAGIESHIIVPLVQRYAVKLPPAVAVVALYLMAELFGFLGILLAIPAAATVLVLVKSLYVHDVLGDRPSHWPAKAKAK